MCCLDDRQFGLGVEEMHLAHPQTDLMLPAGSGAGMGAEAGDEGICAQ